jgi:hypothetical protein
MSPRTNCQTVTTNGSRVGGTSSSSVLQDLSTLRPRQKDAQIAPGADRRRTVAARTLQLRLHDAIPDSRFQFRYRPDNRPLTASWNRATTSESMQGNHSSQNAPAERCNSLPECAAVGGQKPEPRSRTGTAGATCVRGVRQGPIGTAMSLHEVVTVSATACILALRESGCSTLRWVARAASFVSPSCA